MKNTADIIALAVCAAFFYLLPCSVSAGQLLINEFTCNVPGDDWVELFYYSEIEEEINIAPLYVTMYYGTNEPLSADPITLSSRDRPETPFDDRYAVIHLTAPGKADETDYTGDTNGNGCLDIYCNNYFGSLWNSDGIVAIDTDDDPANGGIIDVTAYSNRDGSINPSIKSYLISAQNASMWAACDDDNPQMCMIDIGANGLQAHMSVARTTTADSNSMADFAVTPFQTPGHDNIFIHDAPHSKKVFTLTKKTHTVLQGRGDLKNMRVPVFVLQPCTIRFRLFSPAGMMVFESPLYRDIMPGHFNIMWDASVLRRRAAAGMYIGVINGTSRELKKSDSERIFVIVGREK